MRVLTTIPPKEDAVKRFIARYADKIIGVLSGFDRLVLRGTLRQLAFATGMMGFLRVERILLKDFGAYVERVTDRVREACYAVVRELDRPIVYLRSSQTDKEAVARRIAQEDGIDQGLIALLTSVEPCRSYGIHGNEATHRLELTLEERKCLHLYWYFVDPVFGFMNARLQTWFPFNIQLCVNGREWLSRQMDRAGIRYERRDNCFARIDDLPRAQALMDEQVKLAWPQVLGRIARSIHPIHEEIFKACPLRYYWSAYQSEWATDLMFQDARSLAEIYPALVRHGITTFSSPDVMRFLGQKLCARYQGQVVTSFKERPEGVRIKHYVAENSIKLYDKQGSILRVETTINNARRFKAFRRSERDSTGPRAWKRMRQGIADLQRRTVVSQAANDRYLDAMAVVDPSRSLADLTEDLCRPVRWKKRPVRGLKPWLPEELALFKAVTRGEFSINGFRNKDLQSLLFPTAADPYQERRRRSARVTRLIRLLRAHRLVRKISGSHRYVLSDKGREILSALVTAQTLTLDTLRKAAA